MASVYLRHGSPLMVDYTPGSAVTAGAVVLIGGRPHIAHTDIAASRLGAMAMGGGVYSATADGVIAIGTAVYWDAGSAVVTATASGNTYLGIVVTASAGASEIIFYHNASEVSGARSITIPASNGKVGGTAGWTVGAADDLDQATVAASQTASTFVIPISGLQVGDTITAFNLIGQIESAGNAATIDADLRKQTAVAAAITDASVGAITQISVTADTKVDVSNSAKTGLTEVVAQDETFYLLLTVTTAASTDVALMGATVIASSG